MMEAPLPYPTEYIRDLKAKRAALRQIAEARERHAEAEQLARLSGDEVAEDRAHQAVLATTRAYAVELDDPEPEEPA
jgi:hypothetical protein